MTTTRRRIYELAEEIAALRRSIEDKTRELRIEQAKEREELGHE